MDELLHIKVKTTGDTDLLRIQYRDVEKSLTIIWTIEVATKLFEWYLLDNKHYFIILISLVSFIDMSAYSCGKLIGKNKITSAISPNKTYEGYIGALVLTIFAFIIISNHFNFQWTSSDIILLLIFIATVFFGDFLMSLMKRVFEIKDTGSILPGHGGILDRLDSYFTSLPIFYLWFLF